MSEKKEKAQKPKERRKEAEKAEKLKDAPKANDSDSEVCFSFFIVLFITFSKETTFLVLCLLQY